MGRVAEVERDRLDLATVALLAGGMAAFGSATPVSAIVGRELPPSLASGLRMTVALAVLAPILARARARGDEPPVAETLSGLDRRDWSLLLGGVAAVGTFGFSVLMLLGMRHAPGAVAAVVMATTPAVTAIGAVLFLGDRLDLTRAAAVALAVAGVVVVNLGSGLGGEAGRRPLLGTALVFGAVLCEAVYSLVGKKMTAGLSARALVTAAAVGALVLFAPFMVWDALTFDWSRPSIGQWLAAVWWGAGTMALGSVLWFRGMARVPAGRAAPFMAVMPVSALLLSYVLLGETFAPIHAVGMGLVLGGLVVVIRTDAPLH